jgi:hypothetical protein
MGEQPTTEERVSFLERMLFAILTRQFSPTDETYKVLRGMLLDHPEERRHFPDRDIETDPSVKWFRAVTSDRTHLTTLIEKIIGEQQSIRNDLDKLHSERQQDVDAQLTLIQRLKKIEHELQEVSHDHTQLLVQLSESDFLQNERFRRVLPIFTYLSEDDPNLGAAISAAMQELSRAIGFERFDEEEARRGSWFKRSYQRAKEALTRPEVQNRLRKAERALEMKNIDLVQSEIDLNLASAAAKLKETLEGVENGIVSLGSLFAVKTVIEGKPRMAVVSLSQDQMQKIRDNPELQMDPLKFFQAFGQTQNNNISVRSSKNVGITGRQKASDKKLKNPKPLLGSRTQARWLGEKDRTKPLLCRSLHQVKRDNGTERSASLGWAKARSAVDTPSLRSNRVGFAALSRPTIRHRRA